MKLTFLLLDSQFPLTLKSSDSRPSSELFLQERQVPPEHACGLDWERRKFWRVWLPGRGLSPPGRGLSPPGRGLSPPGRGLSPPGRGLSPPGRGLSPPGRGLSPPIPKPPGLGSSRVCSCWLTAGLSISSPQSHMELSRPWFLKAPKHSAALSDFSESFRIWSMR